MKRTIIVLAILCLAIEALALTAGHRLNAGARQVVIVRLAARSQRGTGAIGFGDYPVMREVVDVDANVLPAVFDFGINQNTLKTLQGLRK